MAKKRKKKSIFRSAFYRIYFVLVLLCIVGIIFGVRYLNGMLADFESAQPVYVAQEAARMFETFDFDTIYTLDTSAAEISDGDQAFYTESMREITAGKQVSWNEGHSSGEDEKVYRVQLDGEKFAEFTLVPSGNETSHGNRLWTLDSVTTYVTLAKPEPEPTPEPTPEAPAVEMITCTITVPSDFRVVVNGETLAANNVVTGDIPTASAGLLPEHVKSPTLIQYAFLSETEEPEFNVTDANGAPQTPTPDGEHSWSCPVPQSPELRLEVEESVVEIAKRIARYSAKDLSKGGILQYCARSSPAREALDSFDSTWGTPHNGAVFENIVTSDYYMYSDDCFSCHVTFDYVATFGKDTVKTYPSAYTLYFIKENGKGKLYNFTLY